MRLYVTDTTRGYVFGKTVYWADADGAIDVPDDCYVAEGDARFKGGNNESSESDALRPRIRRRGEAAIPDAVAPDAD
jgi:hypothetical protein